MHTDQPLELFISPRGNDAWSGRLPEPRPDAQDGPFATLERARDALRAARTPGRAAVVYLRDGKYFLERPLKLTAADSGTATAPVVYRAYGTESVRLIGGRELPEFVPVRDPAIRARLLPAAREHVRQCDLRALGITDYGQYHQRGHSGGYNVAALELFHDGEVMTVARWPKRPALPNNGFLAITGVRKDGERGFISFADDRPKRWAPAADRYVHGYFSVDWASNIARVASLDPERQELSCDPPGVSAYGARVGGRFFFFNVLEELSEPGEWYLDRHSGILCFWPPGDGESLVSLVEEPLIELTEVEYVRFERLTIEAMRGDAIVMHGGRGNVIAGGVLRNVGKDAVVLDGGTAHRVQSCDLFQTGECGIRIMAGDRRTLTPCAHVIENCHLHHLAREGWTYCGAIELPHSLTFGCGVTVRHCRLHDHRHALASFKGNDHRFEYNEFYNATLEGDDCGIMYTGRDFTMQGHVVRYNYFHHAGDSGRNAWGSAGVYMDDGAGGTDIYGNIFQYVNKAVLAGGGLNIRIHHNVFVDCRPAIWFDQRCAAAGADGAGSMVHDTMRGNFQAVQGDSPVYARYPYMDYVVEVFRRHLGAEPRGAVVAHNLVVGGSDWLATHWQAYPDYFEYHDNLVSEDPRFVAPEFGVYQLAPDSPAFAAIGFRPLPWEEIGLVHDQYRTTVEDVLSGLELITPPRPDGQPGWARLRLRNRGDVAVAGVELVEVRARRHGPGFMHVAVPYEVAPGQEAAFEFALAVPPEALANLGTLMLCSRGERLRPAWLVIPVAYPLTSELATLTPPVAGPRPQPGRVRLTWRNLGQESVQERVALTAMPVDRVVWGGEPATVAAAAPGAVGSAEFSFAVTPGPGAWPSRVCVSTQAARVQPATLAVRVEYPLPVIATPPDLAALAELLAVEPLYAMQGCPRMAAPGHYADVRLAVAGDCLALVGEVFDPQVRVTEMLWDGSCIEVFGCELDRERLGPVFGAIPLGQVYLVPATTDAPARGYRVQQNDPVATPEIRVAMTATAHGYRLTALVPLTCLAVTPYAERFLFEVQVTTTASRDGRACRGNLFGSQTAFNDSSHYGLAVVRR